MINLDMTERFLKQQTDCLDILTELIAFDKEHGEPPENTRVLEAFIDTQRRALDLAGKLLEKHKPALEEAAKAEREKREAESKIKAAEAKEAQKKEQAKKDLEKAKTDENSLFCDFADEEADPKADELTEDDEEADDGYGFEEDDEE